MTALKILAFAEQYVQALPCEIFINTARAVELLRAYALRPFGVSGKAAVGLAFAHHSNL
ncbi:hypothetical protein [Sedimenticola selenatireducens]|uniref:hypothetical protein n=1 Tax=Sedimenticola selenatireducens TaxID=191960 RepID=UPI001642364F|nr:hypothetical protein [Sedimenticola selenatireducens]